MKTNTYIDKNIHAIRKELDQVSCPICMDHPHNAVLLICSSYEKGCRPYICDTSYRHSNCLDRFKKMIENCGDDFSQPSSSFHENSISGRAGQEASYSHTSVRSIWSPEMLRNWSPVRRESVERYSFLVGQVNERVGVEESWGRKPSELNDLKCPLCRGTVSGWKTLKEAREYLDLKQRSCSRESCSFIGNYKDLRRHARRVHPTTRPADVDPSRQHAWSRLEHQQEHGDILSAVRSAMPGAVVVGDYIIDDGDEASQGWDMNYSSDSWTTFFLLRMIETSDGSQDERTGISRSSRGQRLPIAHQNISGERRRYPPIAHQNISGERRRYPPIGRRNVLGERRRHSPIGRRNLFDERRQHSPIARHNVLGERRRHSPTGHRNVLNERRRHSPIARRNVLGERRRHSPIRRRNLLRENLLDMQGNDDDAREPDSDDNWRPRNLLGERRRRSPLGRRNLLRENLFNLQDSDADAWETGNDDIQRPRNLLGERRRRSPIRRRNSLRENLLNLQDNDDDAWQSDSDDIPRPRRHRRILRSNVDNEQL